MSSHVLDPILVLLRYVRRRVRHHAMADEIERRILTRPGPKSRSAPPEDVKRFERAFGDKSQST